MTFTIHVWHVLILLSLAVTAWTYVPVQNDAYGAGAFMKSAAGLGLLLLIWLAYFAGRFFLG